MAFDCAVSLWGTAVRFFTVRQDRNSAPAIGDAGLAWSSSPRFRTSGFGIDGSGGNNISVDLGFARDRSDASASWMGVIIGAADRIVDDSTQLRDPNAVNAAENRKQRGKQEKPVTVQKNLRSPFGFFNWRCRKYKGYMPLYKRHSNEGAVPHSYQADYG